MALDDASKALLDELAAGDPTPLHELTLEQARGAFGPELARRVGDGPEMRRVGAPRLCDACSCHRMAARADRLLPRRRLGGRSAGRDRDARAVLAAGPGAWSRSPSTGSPPSIIPGRGRGRLGRAAAGARSAAGLPLIVAGDSAGGNLAAVVAQRHPEGPAVALQVLVEPVTDADTETASYATRKPADRHAREHEWFSTTTRRTSPPDAIRDRAVARGSLRARRPRSS